MTIVTVITQATEAVPLARLALRLAHAEQCALRVLWVDRASEDGEVVTWRATDDGEPPAEGTELGELIDVLRADLAALEAPPRLELLRAQRSYPLDWVRREAREAEARIVVVAKEKERRRQGTSLARKLFTQLPCRVLIVHPGEWRADTCSRILVPAADSPHAETALRLGERLAHAADGKVVALYLQPPAGRLAHEVGTRILDRVLRQAGVAKSPVLEAKVVLADHRQEAIQAAVEEGNFDLLLLGASEAGGLRRLLFGTLPDRLLSGSGGMAVAVARARWRLLARLRHSLGQWLDLTIPQRRREERVTLYERLQSGSEWSFDFMLLIALSTAIAGLGLLQNSAAVVIGAMLVAPLMTPILGAGLALVQGNLPLLRIAGKAMTLGYLLALAIGFLLGLLVPIPSLTPELAARGGPTLLDLGVAFLSGLAAAHCLARPGLLAALPGVAIAAALVPPIATSGITLALGDFDNARGAALLYLTNVVAIILGAACSLYASGIRGKRGAGNQRWVRASFLALLLGTVGLSIPLSSDLKSNLLGGSPATAPELHAALVERLDQESSIELLRIDPPAGDRRLHLFLRAAEPLSPALQQELARIVRQHLGEQIRLRLHTELAADL